MISQKQLQTLHENSIQTDMFGRKLKVGDLVLVKGYYSLDKDTFAIIKKVNNKSIVLDIEYRYTDWGAYDRDANGNWYYPNRTTKVELKEMKRKGYETLLITEEFKSSAIAEGIQTIEDHPELFI